MKRYKRIDAVCGRYYEGFLELVKEYRNDGRIHLYQSHSRLSELMLEADIAISAGGTTLFELCAAGVPTITYTIADNQTQGAEWFNENAMMGYAGDARRDDNFSETEFGRIFEDTKLSNEDKAKKLLGINSLQA